MSSKIFLPSTVEVNSTDPDKDIESSSSKGAENMLLARRVNKIRALTSKFYHKKNYTLWPSGGNCPETPALCVQIDCMRTMSNADKPPPNSTI